MGQKVHPYGFRLGYNKPWKSRWFAKRDYGQWLHEDLKLKRELKNRLRAAGISTIEIDRMANKLRISIRTARPGIIIGRKGSEIDKLKADLQKTTGREIYLDIQEVYKPELDAQLVAEAIALQLEKRIAFRRAVRKAVDSALRFGCKGIKVRVSGRLNGAEIARSEWYLQGQLPLHTLRADIDYGFSEAHTTYGVIGVKAWVYKGEILDTQVRPSLFGEPEPRRMPPRDRRDRDRRPAPPPLAEPFGPPVQAAPGEMPQPARIGTPITPPLAPPQPAWKQELKQEAPAASESPESAAETNVSSEPAGDAENPAGKE
jgi:small subunit ribosomal protein S3